MVAFAENTFGKLNVVFNNAGIFHNNDNSVTNTSEEIWDLVININLKGVFLGCQYAIPALLRAGGGSIINTASFVAILGRGATDRLHGQQGGRSGHDSGDRRGVRAAGHSRQLALPRTGRDSPARGAARRSGAAQPAAGAHPDGSLCSRRGDGQRGAVPGSDESSYVNGASSSSMAGSRRRTSRRSKSTVIPV